MVPPTSGSVRGSQVRGLAFVCAISLSLGFASPAAHCRRAYRASICCWPASGLLPLTGCSQTRSRRPGHRLGRARNRQRTVVAVGRRSRGAVQCCGRGFHSRVQPRPLRGYAEGRVLRAMRLARRPSGTARPAHRTAPAVRPARACPRHQEARAPRQNTRATPPSDLSFPTNPARKAHRRLATLSRHAYHIISYLCFTSELSHGTRFGVWSLEFSL